MCCDIHGSGAVVPEINDSVLRRRFRLSRNETISEVQGFIKIPKLVLGSPRG